jgi:cell division protein FtsW
VSRTQEISLVVGAAVLASLGVALVNAATAGALDAQVALTFIVFAASFGGISVAVERWAPDAIQYLLPPTALLTAVGFTIIYRLDPEAAARQRWWLLIAAALAILTLWALDRYGVAPLAGYPWLTLSAALALLALPLLPSSWPLGGAEINGSRIWIQLDLFGSLILRFQPSEVAKLLLVFFLASYLSQRQPVLSQMPRRLGKLRLPEPRQLMPLVIGWFLSLVLLVYQRDLGASLLLLALFVVMLYAATSRSAYLGAGATLALMGIGASLMAFEHVQRRFDAWIRPFEDVADTGYQVAQGLFAMGTGSLTGSGLGLGRPDLIPSATTDYVFAAVAEELGLAGSLAVIAGFALLLGVGFGISLRARDTYRKLLAAGLIAVVGLQSVLILAGVTRLLPVTGVALPFVSYGGSALVSNTIIVVLLLRLSSEQNR